MTAELLRAASLPEAFAAVGMPWPGEPDGRAFKRFATNPKRRDDRSGWLHIFSDKEGAVFGDWRTGQVFTWQRLNGHEPSPTERAAWRAKVETAQREAEAQRDAEYKTAALEARTAWEAGGQLHDDFPYLRAKGIGPHSARLAADGRMMIPVRGPDREIQSIQYIGPDGTKRFHFGGKVAGGWCLLGTVKPGVPLLLAEGFATASSLYQATNYPVFAAFTAGNLAPVARWLRTEYPRHPILVCGDDDRLTDGNPGRTKAEAAAREIGAKTVFPDCQGTDFNDWSQESGPAAIGKTIEAALLEQAKQPPQRFSLLTASELASRPPLPWRVRGLLPAEGLGAIFGPSGAGKSFIGLDLQGAISAGSSWFGYPVTPAPCVYVGLEGEVGIAQRVRAYSARRGSPEGLRVVLPGTFDLRYSDDRAGLVAAVKAANMGGGVLILDTLNRAAPGLDENDSRGMGEVITSLKAIQTELGGLVLVAHHSGKDPLRGLRGHSSLLAAMDAVVEVSRQEDRREWRLMKSKDGSDDKAHPFRLDVVELGADAEGWPVTSCVVVPEESAAEAVNRANLPRGGNQRIVWDGLGELLRDSKDFGQAGAPPTRPCVRLDEAIHALRDRLPCEPDRQTERTRLAVTGLISKGLIQHREGWLWCA